MPMLTALGEADWLPEPVDEELIRRRGPRPRADRAERSKSGRIIGLLLLSKKSADKRYRSWQSCATYQAQTGRRA